MEKILRLTALVACALAVACGVRADPLVRDTVPPPCPDACMDTVIGLRRELLHEIWRLEAAKDTVYVEAAGLRNVRQEKVCLHFEHGRTGLSWPEWIASGLGLMILSVIFIDYRIRHGRANGWLAQRALFKVVKKDADLKEALNELTADDLVAKAKAPMNTKYALMHMLIYPAVLGALVEQMMMTFSLWLNDDYRLGDIMSELHFPIALCIACFFVVDFFFSYLIGRREGYKVRDFLLDVVITMVLLVVFLCSNISGYNNDRTHLVTIDCFAAMPLAMAVVGLLIGWYAWSKRHKYKDYLKNYCTQSMAGSFVFAGVFLLLGILYCCGSFNATADDELVLLYQLPGKSYSEHTVAEAGIYSTIARPAYLTHGQLAYKWFTLTLLLYTLWHTRMFFIRKYLHLGKQAATNATVAHQSTSTQAITVAQYAMQEANNKLIDALKALDSSKKDKADK